MSDQVCSGLSQLNRGLLGFLRQKLIFEGGHLAVGAHIVLLETLLQQRMLMQEGAYLRSKDIY